MPIEWREFEKLVARIERALAPKGAVIKSPDRIRDIYTGSLREVDASIRYRVGTTPILITVECRKRDAIQDDTWMEQLVTKKHKIGAAKTIAVSSSGFTEPAIKTAHYYGIEIRKIEEITPNDICGWLEIESIIHIIYRPILETFQIRLYERDEGDFKISPSPDPTVTELLAADAANAPVFIRHSNGKALSINDMLPHLQRRTPHLFDDIPVDGTKVRRNMRIVLPRGLIHFLTTDGPRDVYKLLLGFDYYAERVETPATDARTFVYSDGEKPLVYGSEALTELYGQPLTLSVHKEVGSEMLHLTISKNEPDAGEGHPPKSLTAPAT